MTDEQTPASGNRWEPAGDQPPTETPAAISTDTAEAAQVERPPLHDRLRPAVAASVAAAAVVAGLGGFAVGRATADGSDGRIDLQQVGFDRDGDDDGDGRGFGQDGGPQMAPPGGPGQQQGQPGSTT